MQLGAGLLQCTPPGAKTLQLKLLPSSSQDESRQTETEKGAIQDRSSWGSGTQSDLERGGGRLQDGGFLYNDWSFAFVAQAILGVQGLTQNKFVSPLTTCFVSVGRSQL